MRSDKGFSRLELVMAILLICVLIGIFLPRYLKHVKAGSAEVCSFNRATIVRLYKAHVITDPDCTLWDVLAGRCPDFEDDTSDYTCPNGGIYTVSDDGRILCSLHGD